VTVWVGTSGWQYKDWRPGYYPDRLPQRLWLEHYSTQWRTVEVNNAFYRLPERSTFEQWAARTPTDFMVVVKASRYLTHIKRLRDPQEPVTRLMDRARGLGRKLGPILVQLPPRMALDLACLDATLAAFASYAVPVAVEVRDPAWFVDDVRIVLERHGAAQVWADRHERPLGPVWRTSPWGYLRFHEGCDPHWPDYTEPGLRRWVDQIRDTYDASADVWVFFNNDPTRAALRNAVTFSRLAAEAGLDVTRCPDATAITSHPG
jgi:uncharacterized protein YecE (DUF72 family)